MNSTTHIQVLDIIIEKSELALSLIEEQEWEHFIDTQQQRQALFDSLQSQEMASTTEIIQRFKTISALNKLLLEQSQAHQEKLKETLKSLHKSKSVDKAYQQ